MNSPLVRARVLAPTIMLAAALSARSQSAYSNALMNLNPVAYWPLQETVQPPPVNVETNLGSFGSMANAYYASTNAVQGFTPGAIAGSSDTAVNFLGNNQSFMIVPTTDNRVSLPAGQPFTVECWTYPTGTQSYIGLVSQTGPIGSGGLNAGPNTAGWSLNQNFIPSKGTASGNNPAGWSFHVFNGVGNTGGAEAYVPPIGGSSITVNQWYHLVGVFDGTNCRLYVNGTDLTASQIAINGSFTPDTWDPIEFGCNRGLGANPYHGALQEVAIYTNALTADQIANHYAAGTNGLGAYQTTILGDNPAMFWTMSAPYHSLAMSGYPTAANYGSLASSMTNLNTHDSGPNCAVYQPGTVPGVAGPQYPGFGDLTNACAFNGLIGAVDAGYNSVLDPTGATNNFSVLVWFKPNPMDNNGRWNCLASHSDSSWKLQFQNGNTKGYKGAGSQPNIAPGTLNVNDGKWHMYVLESTYTNGVSTNVTVFLDSGAVSATAAVPNSIPGKPTLDAFIGGAPDLGYVQPTNGTYNSGQQYFAGRVAHVAYFNRALTPAEIKNLYYTAVPVPVITMQPVSATVGQYSAFTNTVTAAPTNYPMTFQWYKDGAPLATQTGASLIIDSVQPSDQSSDYYVVVSNSYGSVTSSVVNLTVATVVTLTSQSPITYTNPITLYGGSSPATIGSSPTFSVSAVGASPLTFQWTTNGVAVAGATSTTFTFTNCQMDSPTSFACVASNPYGSVTLASWSASYIPAPTAPFPQAVLAAQPIGYWRLNEQDDQAYDGNMGAICNDYQGANNGVYTNVYLGNIDGGTGYNPGTDPNEPSAQFGYYNSSGCLAGGIATNIDFGVPAGSNAEFSVAVWANGAGQPQAGNAGLVTKGNWGAEQFTIDEGAPGSALRFTVRDASGAVYFSANSSVQLANDANWHYVVATCDEANGAIYLYIDGVLAGTATIPPGSGLLKSSTPITIGARMGGGGTFNAQFKGYLNEAAVYNYALSSNQVVAQYESSGVPANISKQPISSININQGSDLIVPAMAIGTPPLSYQWYDYNGPVPGQTNATLVVSNIQSSDNYYLQASNAYGQTSSLSVSVNVFAGAPQIYTDVQAAFYGPSGGTAKSSVVAYGTAPLTYQWQFLNGDTWVNLPNNSHFVGALTNALTITGVQGSDIGNYRVIVANSSGSVTSSVATLTVVGSQPLSFYGSGLFWTANGSARISNNQLSLTDPNNGGGGGTYFFQTPQYIGSFKAAFTYQDVGGGGADGSTFILQNDPRGTAAIGGGGGSLGVSGIIPSLELELNIFSGNTVGYSLQANGAVGGYTTPGSVQLNSGRPIDITVVYKNPQVELTFTDATANPPATYSTTVNVGDITSALGADTAYVGFTGSYGGISSVQTITNFSFVSIPAQTLKVVGNVAIITWPGMIDGYVLQRSSDLSSPNWVDVTSTDNIVNGQHQVIEPVGETGMFYRLILKQ